MFPFARPCISICFDCYCHCYVRCPRLHMHGCRGRGPGPGQGAAPLISSLAPCPTENDVANWPIACADVAVSPFARRRRHRIVSYLALRPRQRRWRCFSVVPVVLMDRDGLFFRWWCSPAGFCQKKKSVRAAVCEPEVDE